VAQKNSSQVQRRNGKSYVMPDTYATVVPANLNQQSGGLNLPGSPRSVVKYARNKNLDLGTDPQQYCQATLTGSHARKCHGAQAFLSRRRPQTTKRHMKDSSALAMQNQGSILTQKDQVVNVNQAALMRTHQLMVDSQLRSSMMHDELSADPEITAEMQALPRIVATADGAARGGRLVADSFQGSDYSEPMRFAAPTGTQGEPSVTF